MPTIIQASILLDSGKPLDSRLVRSFVAIHGGSQEHQVWPGGEDGLEFGIRITHLNAYLSNTIRNMTLDTRNEILDTAWGGGCLRFTRKRTLVASSVKGRLSLRALKRRRIG